MTVTAEILATWRDPSGPVGRLLATGPREDRSLAILIGASLLLFVARAPGLARAAHLDPSVPLEARFGVTLFVMLFLLPLIAYGIALAVHAGLRAAGFTGAAHGARIALFWALLAVAPAALAHGLVEGLAGPGGVAALTGLAVFAAFLWFFGRGLSVAYRRDGGRA